MKPDEPVAYGYPNSAITGSNAWMMLREKVPADDQYKGALWVPLVLASSLAAAQARIAELEAQQTDIPDGMWRISKLIAALHGIQSKFGDTCVWMRECKWGGAALNAEAEAARKALTGEQR